MHMLYSNYMVLFMPVDLRSQCMGQVSEPVNICLGKALKKSLNWWMTKACELWQNNDNCINNCNVLSDVTYDVVIFTCFNWATKFM